MKTITNLTATESSQPQQILSAAVPHDIHVVQSQKGFWRRARISKRGLFFESSSAGLVFVSIADLWTLVESHDSNLKIPAKPATPKT